MLLLYIQTIISLRPTILVPGLYGSNLYATYKSFSKHWYCPHKIEKELMWANIKYLVPPRYNCLFEAMSVKYDEKTNTMISEDNIQMDIQDFGGDKGMLFADQGILGHHFIELFDSMFKFFTKKGYTVHKDLFGLPYDWRLAIAGLEKTFYPKIREIVELAYNLNGQKVVLLGYSLGGFCLQRFLSKFCTQEWKNKYIHKLILLSPAFGGSSATVDPAWNQYFPLLPYIKPDSLKYTIQHMPALHSLFPNHVIYGNDPIIFGPNNEITNAAQLPQLLISLNKITGPAINLLNLNVEISKQEPLSPNVPTYIFYNSAIDTVYQLNFKKGYNKDPTLTYQPGDGTLPSRGIEYVCNKWSSTEFPLYCHDLNNKNKNFGHTELSQNYYVMDQMYSVSIDQNDDWVHKKGSFKIISPYVEATNSTYKVFYDI